MYVTIKLILFLLSGCGGQSARGGLLYPDSHPLHHPGLLHRPHRQPAQEEDGRRSDEAEESRLSGDRRHGGLLRLLPPLHLSQDGSADRPGQKHERTRSG